MSAAPIERTVRAARRRLFLQALLNRLVACSAGALVLALGWLLAEPWLIETPPDWLKWAVAGGLAGVGTVLAVVLAVRAAPTRTAAALELDARFNLKERVTTALSLRPDEAATPAGQAVVTDAAAKVAPLAVRTKFPVGVRWESLGVPALAGCLALAAVFYHPNTARTEEAEAAADGKKPADALKVAQQQEAKKGQPDVKPKPPERLDRADKSEKLKELESELDKLMEKFAKDPKGETEEKQKEKVTELTAMEEKAKKFSEEKFQKLAQMEQQLRQLNKLQRDSEFGDGPAKELNDALSKGDLKKAQDEIDQLKKKARDKNLDPKDQERLGRQLDRMKDELEQLAKNKEREDRLKKLIEQAKKENRDAEALERELNELKQNNAEANQALEELAQRLNKARQAAEKGDLEDLAEALEAAGKELKDMENELQDIEDAEEFLQRLKGEKCDACKKCGGNCKGDKEGDENESDWNNGGIGKGKRKENPNAQTSSADERIKGLFDPRGKKSYGGTTRGQAFNKRTTADLGTEIQEAVQEAPQAADYQRLPRDARDAVKEYFQNLGGQSPGGNK